MKQTKLNKINGLNRNISQECPPISKEKKLIEQSEACKNVHAERISASVRNRIDHFVTFKGSESKQAVINNPKTNGDQINNETVKSGYSNLEHGKLIMNQVNIMDYQTDFDKKRSSYCSNLNKDFCLIECDSNKVIKKSTKAAQSKHLDKDKPPFRYAGIMANLLCALFMSIQSVAIKLLPNPHSINEKAKALFFRGLFILTFCSLASIYNKSSLRVPRNEIWLNFARCLTGVLSQFGGFCALAFISAADSKAIVFTAPIWTSIASRIVFNDSFKLIQVFALPATMFGIVLVAHPSLIVGNDSFLIAKPILESSLLYRLTNITLEPQNDWICVETNITETSGTPVHDDGFTRDERWIGVVISIGVSFLATANYIVLTFKRKTPVQTTTFWLGLTVLVTAMAVMAGTGHGNIPDTLQEWILLITIGISAWAGQSLLQWAFLYERADVLSIVRTSDVAFTFILSALVLDEPMYGSSIVGALIITTVVILLILNDLIQKFLTSSKTYSLDETLEEKKDAKDKNPEQIYTITSSK